MALTHAQPLEVIDLRPLGPALVNSKTTALVKAKQFEAVRLVLPAGKGIAAHSLNGEVTLLCLEGRVTLNAGKDIILKTGDWVYLDRGATHSLSAELDSSLLMTIHFDA